MSVVEGLSTGREFCRLARARRPLACRCNAREHTLALVTEVVDRLANSVTKARSVGACRRTHSGRVGANGRDSPAGASSVGAQFTPAHPCPRRPRADDGSGTGVCPAAALRPGGADDGPGHLRVPSPRTQRRQRRVHRDRQQRAGGPHRGRIQRHRIRRRCLGRCHPLLDPQWHRHPEVRPLPMCELGRLLPVLLPGRERHDRHRRRHLHDRHPRQRWHRPLRQQHWWRQLRPGPPDRRGGVHIRSEHPLQGGHRLPGAHAVLDRPQLLPQPLDLLDHADRPPDHHARRARGHRQQRGGLRVRRHERHPRRRRPASRRARTGEPDQPDRQRWPRGQPARPMRQRSGGTQRGPRQHFRPSQQLHLRHLRVSAHDHQQHRRQRHPPPAACRRRTNVPGPVGNCGACACAPRAPPS